MGILRDFERRLEGIVEGLFTKAFRSGVQPVELAKRVLREMDGNQTVGVKGVWVPNRYVFSLSSEDREQFARIERSLASELEQVVVDGARERGWGLLARPKVVFDTDEKLKRGEFRVESELTEETGGPPTGPQPKPQGAPATAGAGALLALVEDGSVVKEFSLQGDRMVIGRMEGSDVQIADPGASRRHAEVRRDGDDYILVDLGSTNGTLVNEAPVSERTLEEGDRITIGRTVLEFRRG
ncbi:MAG: FhaA domain-containing protein [Actinomycetota bacterium]